LGDGVAILRFCNEIFADSNKMVMPSIVNKDVEIKPLPIELTPKLKESLINAANKVDDVTSKLELKIGQTSKGLGQNYIKSKKLSPDSTIQTIFQIAHYNLYKNIVSTYESASTAAFKHGRTECIRSATVESTECAKIFANPNSTKQQKEESLRKAVKVHSQLVRDAVQGKGVDRHLFALRKLSEAANSVPEIFKDVSYKKMGENILSTSTLQSDALGGGGFAPVHPEGFGIGYYVRDDDIAFVLSSYRKDTQQFVNAILDACKEVKTLLD